MLLERDAPFVSANYETSLWEKGIKFVAGVDEAGRGPLAGPVVAAAVVFPPNFFFPFARDSKKLNSAQRENILRKIFDKALAIGIGIINEKEIDKRNILKASLSAMYEALATLTLEPGYVLVDGNQKIPHLQISQLSIVKGDNLSFTIASASIVAKVIRDFIMDSYHNIYPHFQFNSHRGYCTKQHLQILKNLGPSPIHRLSFAPVKEALVARKELTLSF